ncbi:MAG: hypothetical protein AAF849_22020 [Bacteroidota bacterium]
MESTDIQEKAARVFDILEQIGQLNVMVNFHRDQSKELSMMRQYESMRADFLKELKAVLNDFKINVQIEGIAA